MTGQRRLAPLLAALGLGLIAGCTGVGGPAELAPAGAPQAGTTGGMVASTLAEKLDPADRAIAAAAEGRALDGPGEGAPQIWRSPSGAFGEVSAGASFQSGGRPCRDFTHTIYINKRPEVAQGTACRTGRAWRLVSA